MPKSVEVNKGQRQSQWKLMKDAALCKDPQSVISKILEQLQRGNSAISFLGQHQSQWILMKDAALDKDPQSIIFKVFIAVG